MTWLEHNFGGWVGKQQPGYPNSKVVYTWHMTNVRELLRKVYLYLILKRGQAKIVMDFPVSLNPNGYRTEEDKLRQEHAYQRIRELNRTGCE